MALDKNKTAPITGGEVREHLIELGVETPMVENRFSTEEQMEVVKESFQAIMTVMGLDLADDSLQDTPNRVAKMFIKELFWGLDYHNFPKVTVIANTMGYNSMLLERNIKVNSNCEHHFVPILGRAYVAYIPKDRVIGLSKLNRIVEFFCRRPQVQERLAEQIFHTLCYLLDTDNVAVLIKADHLCVKSRGVEDVNSDTITTRLGGHFSGEALRTEFYNSIRL